MQLVRETLAQDTVLTFYDVRKPATIQADASQSGLGCGLMQQGRPVALASRALTEAEHNYSQIEKDYVIAFACPSRPAGVFFFGVRIRLEMNFNYLILWVRVKGQG